MVMILQTIMLQDLVQKQYLIFSQINSALHEDVDDNDGKDAAGDDKEGINIISSFEYNNLYAFSGTISIYSKLNH